MLKRSRHISHHASLIFAALILAVGGIIYELIIATTASYLLGDSILRFSLTIGLFLFGMGIGAFIVGFIRTRLLEVFVANELLVALLGGNSVALLMFAYAYTPYTQHVFVLLTLIIGAFVGAEIPLLVSILKNRTKLQYQQALSRILSIDYFGSLLASVAFPIILLPALGLTRTAYMTGIFNAAVAGAVVFSLDSPYRRRLLAGSVAIVVVLSSGFLYHNQIQSTLDRAIYNDPVIYSSQSSYQRIVMTRHKDDTRLYLNNNLQFSSIDERRYHETLVHPAAAVADEVKTVLILGGGDGLAAREILKYPGARTTLVDLDPAVTRIARTNNALIRMNERSLLDGSVNVIHDDAFQYIRQTDSTFDLIIADLPDPNNEVLAKLYSVEFYTLVQARLDRGGAFVTQASSPFFTPKSYWTIDATMRQAGLHTMPLHINVPSFGEWGFIIGTRQPAPTPTSLKSDRLSYISDDLVSTLFLFSKADVAPPDLQPSYLIRPTVHRLYEKDFARWQ